MKLKRKLIVIILMICSLTISAQKQIYKLHQIVGDTIDAGEIEKYFLFTDYVNDSIDYFLLFEDTGHFTLTGISDNTTVLDIQISEDEVLLQKEHIERLNNYYNSILKKDSVDFSNLKIVSPTSDSLNVDMRFMSPEFLKSVKKDIRRKYWEEFRKQTRSNQEKGMIF